ncbi:hypothetical protein RJ640_015382 [Escallonia rubra]|uniref:Phorbol-ester/DAG-type domain-containing protein n=1 Tax=Escallonia rubra TaxID=112253 RepID=A0AA88RQM5_9ASTE|nr:hypothetical protein RJ640_015382 [Escallonia rubra]
MSSQNPQQIRHACDRNHFLYLLQKPGGGDTYCNACRRTANGLAYRCRACNIDVHAQCAILPPAISHHSHPHQLHLAFSPPYSSKSFGCDICYKSGSNHWLYRCNSCGFDAHLSCAMSKTRPPQQKFAPNDVRLGVYGSAAVTGGNQKSSKTQSSSHYSNTPSHNSQNNITQKARPGGYGSAAASGASQKNVIYQSNSYSYSVSTTCYTSQNSVGRPPVQNHNTSQNPRPSGYGSAATKGGNQKHANNQANSYYSISSSSSGYSTQHSVAKPTGAYVSQQRNLVVNETVMGAASLGGRQVGSRSMYEDVAYAGHEGKKHGYGSTNVYSGDGRGNVVLDKDDSDDDDDEYGGNYEGESLALGRLHIGHEGDDEDDDDEDGGDDGSNDDDKQVDGNSSNNYEHDNDGDDQDFEGDYNGGGGVDNNDGNTENGVRDSDGDGGSDYNDDYYDNNRQY